MAITEVHNGDHRHLQNIANTLAAARKVVVVTGAGISTNCGIPDFRSEEGLYTLIQAHADQSSPRVLEESTSGLNSASRRSAEDLPLSSSRAPGKIKGKDLFDSLLWNDPTSTAVFYKFISNLREKVREDVKKTTHTHRFIRLLRDRQKLVRCYTQNIDGLEAREGLTLDIRRGKGNRQRFSKKSKAKPAMSSLRAPGAELDGGCEVVQLHGDLDTLRCTLCSQVSLWTDRDREKMMGGRASRCRQCMSKDQDRQDRGKRATKVGTLRPNIVLYGETHPDAEALGSITTYDLNLSPDVLLILGTSLRVHGLKTLIREFAKSVHARPGGKGKVVFVNLSKPSESIWKDSLDYWVSMDCDAWVNTMRKHRPDLWPVQSALNLPLKKAALKPALEKSVISEENKENAPISEGAPREMIIKVVVPVTPKKKPLQDNIACPTSGKRWQPSQHGGSDPALTLPSSQLLTPPSSRGRFLQEQISLKRRRILTEDSLDLSTSPSKRTRWDIDIWND